jgi:hypothetical protein
MIRSYSPLISPIIVPGRSAAIVVATASKQPAARSRKGSTAPLGCERVGVSKKVGVRHDGSEWGGRLDEGE